MSDEKDGAEVIAFVSLIPAILAGVAGFALAGPLGAAAAAAATWAGTYAYMEPRTRPEPKLLASPHSYVRPVPTLPAPPPTPRRLTDEEFRQQHGAPRVFWRASDASKAELGYYYGPLDWMNVHADEPIVWSFFQALGHATTSLVRVRGGENFDSATAQAACDEVQMIAARKFQENANEAFTTGGGMARYYRELAAKQKADREAQRRAENEAREADEKRANEEKARHEAWIRQLREDRDRVVKEIKQGREARLKLWSLDPSYLASTGQEERQRALAEITEQVRKERALLDTYRKQIAEQEAQEAHWKTEREAQQARMKRLEGPIPLATRDDGRIIFGTAVADGYDRAWLPREIQHMLVGGMTGSGKSVFLHQLIHQLLGSPAVDRVVLIDLKGGMEFDRYSDHAKARIVWDMRAAIATFDKLVDLLDARQDEMRLKGLREWNGDRTFVIVDEYAEIHDSINEAKRGDEKESMQRLSNNLKRIIRRARSLGVVMICALQKPTTDAMDSTLRANMNMRVCFRVKTRQTAEAALDAYEDLPANPLELEKGRFVFDDGRGSYHYLQAQIAPGAVASDEGDEGKGTRTASTAA